MYVSISSSGSELAYESDENALLLSDRVLSGTSDSVCLQVWIGSVSVEVDDTVEFITSVVAQIMTSAPPVTVGIGGRGPTIQMRWDL